jgi:putative tryptophan/tyrosine transport system substrate-binding protein
MRSCVISGWPLPQVPPSRGSGARVTSDDRLRRREFITLLGSATAAWPLDVRAQQSKVRRIGALLLGNADAESFRTELRDGLRKLGYVEGQNINFDFRSAGGNIDLLPQLAAGLVALRVDVIVALYTPCASR